MMNAVSLAVLKFRTPFWHFQGTGALIPLGSWVLPHDPPYLGLPSGDDWAIDFTYSSVFICSGIWLTEVEEKGAICTCAFCPSSVKIYLCMVDSEYKYMLSENKDMGKQKWSLQKQSINKHCETEMGKVAWCYTPSQHLPWIMTSGVFQIKLFSFLMSSRTSPIPNSASLLRLYLFPISGHWPCSIPRCISAQCPGCTNKENKTKTKATKIWLKILDVKKEKQQQ